VFAFAVDPHEVFRGKRWPAAMIGDISGRVVYARRVSRVLSMQHDDMVARTHY
jgi:hypothetical protein